MFFRNHAAVAGLGTLAIIVVGSLVGPYLYTVDPYEMVWAPFSEPGAEGFLFGTDYLGRDIFAGIVNGGRVTLAVGLSAALLSVFIGVSIGALSGYFRGWVEEVLMRITEFFQVLPTLLFSMVLVALFGASLAMVTFAIGIVSWTAVARVTRSEFLRLREMEYVTSSRSSGGPGPRAHADRDPPERPPPDRGAGRAHGGERDPLRGGALVPRPERPQRGELGADHRVQPALHPGCGAGRWRSRGSSSSSPCSRSAWSATASTTRSTRSSANDERAALRAALAPPRPHRRVRHPRRHGAGARPALDRARRGGHPRPGGRVRMRQVDDRARDHGARPLAAGTVRGRVHPVRGRRSHPGPPTRTCGTSGGTRSR